MLLLRSKYRKTEVSIITHLLTNPTNVTYTILCMSNVIPSVQNCAISIFST